MVAILDDEIKMIKMKPIKVNDPAIDLYYILSAVKPGYVSSSPGVPDV